MARETHKGTEPPAEREALAACGWIAANSPFQRQMYGHAVCLFCKVAESGAKGDPRSHDPSCLWRRAGALGGSSRTAEALSIAREFVDQGPWERPGESGYRSCILCGEASPSHRESCNYWRLRLHAAIED